MKVTTINKDVNIKVNDKILKDIIRGSYWINKDFYVQYDNDILSGYPIKLLSRSGSVSLNVYMEDFEYAFKEWCKDFKNIFRYLKDKNDVDVSNLKTKDCEFIMDVVTDRAMELEGGAR